MLAASSPQRKLGSVRQNTGWPVETRIKFGESAQKSLWQCGSRDPMGGRVCNLVIKTLHFTEDWGKQEQPVLPRGIPKGGFWEFWSPLPPLALSLEF